MDVVRSGVPGRDVQQVIARYPKGGDAERPLARWVPTHREEAAGEGESGPLGSTCGSLFLARPRVAQREAAGASGVSEAFFRRLATPPPWG